MKPINCTLVYRRGEDGIPGWIPEHCPSDFYCVPAEGNPNNWVRLLCHDILEHSQDDTGTLEDELKALGAVLYGRASNEYTPILSDLVNLVHDCGCEIQEPTNYKDELASEYEYELEANLSSEELTKFLGACESEDLTEDYTQEQLAHWYTVARKWLLLGCDSAYKRFGSDLNLIEAWYNLSEELKETLPGVEEFERVNIGINEFCEVSLAVV